MEKTTSQYEEQLDRVAVLGRLEGNRELMIEVIQLFLEEAPQLMDAMRKACDAGDMQALAGVAHSMKGAAANFSARRTATAAAQLEKDAASGNAESAKASLAALEFVVELLLTELVDFRNGLAK